MEPWILGVRPCGLTDRLQRVRMAWPQRKHVERAAPIARIVLARSCGQRHDPRDEQQAAHAPLVFKTS